MKEIDESVWKAIKTAFVKRKKKPKYRELASEFGVSISAIQKYAATDKWQARRDEHVNSKTEAASEVSANQGRRIDPIDALDGAIADLYYESAATDPKSKEGCANAMANLLKVKRELYPPTALELARMAVQLGIKHEDFLEALKELWEQELEPVETLANKK